MKLNRPIRIFLILLSGINTAALIGSTFFMWQTNFGGLTYGFFGLFLCAFTIYCIYQLLKTTKYSIYFICVTILLTIVVVIGLLIFLENYALFARGQLCSGFFGVSESCLESARFQIFILFYNPVVMYTLLILAFTSMSRQHKQTIAESNFKRLR
jgi:hypothetical protein